MSAPRRGVAHDQRAAAARALGSPSRSLADLLDAGAAAEAFARLSGPQRAVISALVGLGGAGASLLLCDEAAEEIAGGRRATAEQRRSAEAAVVALWESGLVARDRTSRTFFLLPEVARALVAPLRDAIVEALPPAEPAPAPAIDEHLLLCAIAVLRHEPARLTREGQPFKRSLEALAERLRPLLPRKDPLVRVELLVAALAERGIVQQGHEALALVPEAAEAWAQSSHAARVAHALELPSGGALARAALAQLQALGRDRAWPKPVALRVLRRSILQQDAPPTAPDADAAVAEAFEVLERAGLLARTDAGFALTAEGRAFPDPLPVVRPPDFHVGEDLAILVPRGLDAAVHLAVGRVARLESADTVARYRLEQRLVLDALDAGHSASEILTLLEVNAPRLPESVRIDIARWCARFGEVTSHRGIVVTCHVAARHAEFEAVVSGSGLAATVVAPGVAVVEPTDHLALATALSASGFTPRRAVLSPRGEATADGAGRRTPAAAGRPRDATAAAIAGIGSSPPAWGERLDAGDLYQPAPPPAALVAQLKDKYRREFGSAQLAALDLVDLDELLALEEKGGIRQFLAGRTPGTTLPPARLDDYARDEMVAVSPVRARQVLEQAAAAGLRCQVGHATRPGQSTRLLVDPLEVVTDPTGTWLRVRTSSGHERLLAMERIHALRVLRPDPLAPRRG